ncbi:MAG: TolC family protein, partial [Rubripirellula sp.]
DELAGDEDSSKERDPRLIRQRATDTMAGLKRLAQNAILVQARARLESVSIEPIELDPAVAMDIALSNRLDFMNGRAALVDSWRLIAVSADALQSALNITSSGTVLTDRNDPLAFRASTANLRLGLEFDAPFTRLIERNAYREALINYQRNRRSFIQSHDALQVDLRVILRQIKQLEESLEIQRRSVAIAIRRVDLTQAQLEAPGRPAQPGQRPPQLGPTAAINLISAQASLRDTQNRFLSTWLSYYAAKMRLARELGVMALDPVGRWVEDAWSISGLQESGLGNDVHGLIDSEAVIEQAEGLELLPPEVSDEVVEFVEALPEDFKLPIPDTGTKSEGLNKADNTDLQETSDEAQEINEVGQVQQPGAR